MSDNEVKKMVPYAVATAALAIVDVVAIAVLSGFKDVDSTTPVNPANLSEGYLPLINSTYVDYFISGLVVFGVFMAIIVLSLVGKIIISIFTGGKDMM